MDINTFHQKKQEFEQRKADFLQNEAELLAYIEALYSLLEKRQAWVHELPQECREVNRAAVELKTGEHFRIDMLIKGETFGEVLKTWMDRYFERKAGGYDLSMERLISNRATPREKPGVRYSPTGQEVEVLKPRKVLQEGGSMTDAMKKLARW